MKTSRLAIIVIAIFLFLIPSGLWAGGAGAGGDLLESCEVSNPGKGALALKVTAAIWFGQTDVLNAEYLDCDGCLISPATVDVILRVERSGKQKFFRTTFNKNILKLADSKISCNILGLCKGVPGFADQILEAFFEDSASEKELVIIPTSFSETDYDDGSGSTSVGPGRFMRIVDVTLYAIDLRTDEECP